MAEISTEDLAYVAGIIDGEGCIALWKNRETRYRKAISVTPGIGLGMTDSLIIDFIYANFGGCISHSQPKGNRKLVTQYSINSRKELKKLLTSILPYLRLKKQQAKLVLEFIEIREKKRKNNHTFTKAGDSSFDEEWKLWEKMQVLNKTGN